MLNFKTPILLLIAFTNLNYLLAQTANDLKESVPTWLEYDSTNNQATLKWINDDNATEYTISELTFEPFSLVPITTLDGTTNEYFLGELEEGKNYTYHLSKNNTTGVGVITTGIKMPVVHERGRCLIAIDDTLLTPLQTEISTLINDLEMDGWEVDTLNIHRSVEVLEVKDRIKEWYDENYAAAQTLFLLGRIAVPYSGNSAYDGHSNHQGAWSADCFYGEMDGNWTDVTVNNTTPSRQANKNIPGDGKFDQTGIPGEIEMEVGRVDFFNLPAFSEDEIELTRKYLNKNHEFRTGQKDYPRRAIIENNFASFSEGFGQSGWRSYVPMFGDTSVSSGNYDVELETAAYLCSYACGGGSYTSASGIGSTSNLWAAKDIKTVFTMNFGSYFGDWDSQNNFLRGALASGDILTNAWAGRPVWHLYPMALGQPIGYCAKLTQNINSFHFSQGFGSHSTHIALMGDPTLRLHPVKRAADLTADFIDGNINLNWTSSPEATSGYSIYRKRNGSSWELLQEFYQGVSYQDLCVDPNTTYEYMVKAVRLEQSASGSYYNTSQGISTTIDILDNPALATFYNDSDMDGFGDLAVDTIACVAPMGFVANDTDCDDTNPAIYPGATEIPDNGVDEDCDGGDLVSALNELKGSNIKVSPNPAQDWLRITIENPQDFSYQLINANGQIILEGIVEEQISLVTITNGFYTLRIIDMESGNSILQKILVFKS